MKVILLSASSPRQPSAAIMKLLTCMLRAPTPGYKASPSSRACRCPVLTPVPLVSPAVSHDTRRCPPARSCPTLNPLLISLLSRCTPPHRRAPFSACVPSLCGASPTLPQWPALWPLTFAACAALLWSWMMVLGPQQFLQLDAFGCKQMVLDCLSLSMYSLHHHESLPHHVSPYSDNSNGTQCHAHEPKHKSSTAEQS